MQTPIEIRELSEHLEWADAETWTAAISTAGPADERLRSLLIHTHEVQWAYLHLWRGEPVVIPERSSFPDLASVCKWALAYHAARRVFLADVQHAQLERHISFPWASHLEAQFGTVHPTTLRQAILQVALHSAYHRGQVATRLRELGAEPPLIDYVAWVWRGQPAPKWPDVRG